jgi:hypothetical protein
MHRTQRRFLASGCSTYRKYALRAPRVLVALATKPGEICGLRSGTFISSEKRKAGREGINRL